MKKLLVPVGVLALLLGAAFTIASAQGMLAITPADVHADTEPVWALNRVQEAPVGPTPIGTTVQKAQLQQGSTESPPAVYGMPALTLPVTKDQIQAFLSQKGSIPGIYSLQVPTVTSVEFLTAGLLRQRVGVGTLLDKYSDSAPAIDVQLVGQFVADDANVVQPHGEMIFDGVTGNLLTVHIK
jgi:hypothetical protein